MSGGSMNYVYSRVNDAADDVRRFAAGLQDVKRAALWASFARHLDLVAKALHDIEWEMSADYGDGDADEAVRRVVGEHAALAELLRRADEVRGALDECIREARR